MNPLIVAQVRAPAGATIDLILSGGTSTHIILALCGLMSLASWIIIFWKTGQFRKLRKQSARFLQAMERTPRLADAYRSLTRLPESPYTRVFRGGTNFFSELRPGSLAQETTGSAGISEAQLQALVLVLEKVQSEESDDLARGMSWLATIGMVAPLLGLLGTVIGVMDAFIGISAAGSANINAVAPGVAEALVTTVAGLVVAIPAVIGYNHFTNKLVFFEGELEGFASEFIGTLAREGRL